LSVTFGTPVFSTNKTDHKYITEILLKVALNTINQKKNNDLSCLIDTILTISKFLQPKTSKTLIRPVNFSVFIWIYMWIKINSWIWICVYQEICFVYVYVGQKGSMSSIYIILYVSDQKVCRYIYFIMFTEQIKKKGK
jgi:hypothetical protein